MRTYYAVEKAIKVGTLVRDKRYTSCPVNISVGKVLILSKISVWRKLIPKKILNYIVLLILLN